MVCCKTMITSDFELFASGLQRFLPCWHLLQLEVGMNLRTNMAWTSDEEAELTLLVRLYIHLEKQTSTQHQEWISMRINI